MSIGAGLRHKQNLDLQEHDLCGADTSSEYRPRTSLDVANPIYKSMASDISSFVDLDAEISNRAFQLPVREERLAGPHCTGFGDCYTLATAIAASSIPVGQLIFEGAWVHASTGPTPVRY